MNNFTLFQAKKSTDIYIQTLPNKKCESDTHKILQAKEEKIFKDSEKVMLNCTVANWEKEIKLRTQEEKVML